MKRKRYDTFIDLADMIVLILIRVVSVYLCKLKDQRYHETYVKLTVLPVITRRSTFTQLKLWMNLTLNQIHPRRSCKTFPRFLKFLRQDRKSKYFHHSNTFEILLLVINACCYHEYQIWHNIRKKKLIY